MSSAEARAVKYAESLGVHDVHTEAREALAIHKTAQQQLVDANAERREIAERLNEREVELTAEQRAEYHELSATAFEKVIRGALQTDSQMKALRAELRESQARVDQAEADIREAEMTIRMLSARMTELGGLLTFFASAKNASNAAPTTVE